jgi:undecaprenyl-diphosphatase
LDYFTGIILGALQGLTEFLPISSSGHLVLAESVLGGKASTGLIFEVLVHFATMVAVVLFFREKIWKMIVSLVPPYTQDKLPALKLVAIIIIGTIPAAVIGLALENYVESAFGSAKIVSIMLLLTGLILLSTRLAKHGSNPPGYKTGFLIGIAQAAALMPGISRSGTTIAAGLHLKLAPSEAAEFSFLLSLPAVFGATLLKSFDLVSSPIAIGAIGPYIVGAITAFIIGYLSIAWLMRIIKRGKFFFFGIYCLLIGFLGLVLL